ncbi:sulfite oxidase [Pseudarthrobacter sulfonivorans]|uniref:sulfite oxidase n=1 Tax=Pseudarthrobacter sulfonivorans TaxID=121292 RepID=UPI00285DA3FB|nr:sulfite oxidase [Pseudarthrobacter sulfonivorans]MDR6416851.1 DMSO/TMAO reductase YedYZ molybdopterin-dependent catalytic subunit [Pseudarthrobacter sulfonivorans]
MKQIYKHRQSARLAPHPGEPTTGPLTAEELQLAVRNHSMPLEALRRDLTPPGLHYVLTHFDIPDTDAAPWHLQVKGAVERSLELNLAALKRDPAITVPVTLECAGNGRSLLKPRPLSQPWVLEGVGTAEWTGVPLAYLLAKARVLPGAVEVVFTGADAGIQGGVRQQYARSLPIREALRPDVVLAYKMNGSDLPPQHGYPLRLVVPGWYGMASVKWLQSIDVVTVPFEGFQQKVAYKYQDNADDAGVPVSRIRIRSLMVPPGIPDFFYRKRVLPHGPVMLQGRAWSGEGAVTAVEVGIDGQWVTAHLEKPAGPFAWCKWTLPWVADPGEHELSCRATDSTGATQPLAQNWNYQGMGNNVAQRVSVTVE